MVLKNWLFIHSPIKYLLSTYYELELLDLKDKCHKQLQSLLLKISQIS